MKLVFSCKTFSHLHPWKFKMAKNVYISIFSPEDEYGLRDVEIFEARWYQKKAYLHFMKSEKDEESYHFSGGIKFDIIKFDTSNLEGKYPSFCTMITEDGRRQFMSSDKDQLEGFSHWYNRVTTPIYFTKVK